MTTRRANREGTVTQRPNGSWQAEVRWIDRFGRPQRATRTVRTKAEATKALREIRSTAEADLPAGERLVTVEGYWQRWRVSGLVSADRKPSTVELYSGIMRTHVLPAVGGVRLSRLSPGDVERLLAGMVRQRTSRHGMAGQPLSGVTRRTAYAVLSLMLDAAVRDGVATRNVCRDVARPKVDTPEADYLTPAQVRGVLVALRGHRIEPMVLLLATTGVRIGEALALRWSDLDLDQRLLRVTGTVRVVGGEALRTAPKTQRGRRTLPLTEKTVAVLWSWKARQSAERLRAGRSWASTEDWVFTTETGHLLDQRNAVRAYQRALRRAQVQGVPARFHIIRHSVASAMLAEGKVSVRTASEILGHASTSITADTYAHVAQDAKRTALGVVSDALGR